MPDQTRRGFLGTVGAAFGAALMGPRTVSAEPMGDRFIVDASAVEGSIAEVDGLQMVHDLRDHIGYAVVRGRESAIPCSEYLPDLRMEMDEPQFEKQTELDAETDVTDSGYDLQWDKQEQGVAEAHEYATGDGVRIGVVDSGVLGANPERLIEHPDLPNVREDLSVNFTADGLPPGPTTGTTPEGETVVDDHGTHVAGTAAAARNGTGPMGIAPDAEVVDLRVFSLAGDGAATSDIVAATLVAAAPPSEEFKLNLDDDPDTPETVVSGKDCDVVNLSLGVPPLVPIEELSDDPPYYFPDLLPDPYVAVAPFYVTFFDALYSSAGEGALAYGALPVASAGNSGVNLSKPVSDRSQRVQVKGIDAVPSTFPAEADGFLSVGATGPIGHGWPLESEPGEGELPTVTESDPFLPADEPAVYTNYGRESVDVSAGGGNADFDAQSSGVGGWYLDLVFGPTVENIIIRLGSDSGEGGEEEPASEETDALVPSVGWKAGTSFSAPNVSGLAALLMELYPDASTEEIRDHIRATAVPLESGWSGNTTAPSADDNVASDGHVRGDGGSRGYRGGRGGQFDPSTYHGDGHVHVLTAVTTPIGSTLDPDQVGGHPSERQGGRRTHPDGRGGRGGRDRRSDRRGR